MWIQDQNWDEHKDITSVNTRANILHETLQGKIKQFFPEKKSKLTTDDAPWCNDKVKKIKRIKCREYSKHRKSSKWLDLETKYKLALIQAKTKY